MSTQLVPIDSLRLHPDAERVPLAAAADLKTLRESLRQHGQQDPIDVAVDVILDGRTRWSLLRDLGAATVQVREVDVPAGQQTSYIVDRALARRHLTAEQKKALNALLREAVDQVLTHPATGAETRIGKGPTQRARVLGVDRDTVKRWDREEGKGVYTPLPSGPTHQVIGDGRIRPIRQPRGPGSRSQRSDPPRSAPLRKLRRIPSWSRFFSLWCRAARPEDRVYLRRLDREVHAALERNGIACDRGGGT